MKYLLIAIPNLVSNTKKAENKNFTNLDIMCACNLFPSTNKVDLLINADKNL